MESKLRKNNPFVETAGWAPIYLELDGNPYSDLQSNHQDNCIQDGVQLHCILNGRHTNVSCMDLNIDFGRMMC